MGPVQKQASDVIASVPHVAWLLALPIVLALQATILLMMGRNPVCTCGTIKLWHGVIYSPENSQHIFDWYSFTHVLHGLWLYLLTWLLWRRAPLGARFALALVLEGGWEILENTNFVIDRYRASAVASDYYGDSIVNSLSDTITMSVGFVLARLLPVPASVATAVAIELALGYLIRDNLFFNILMLIYPFDGIKAWQTAVPG